MAEPYSIYTQIDSSFEINLIRVIEVQSRTWKILEGLETRHVYGTIKVAIFKAGNVSGGDPKKFGVRVFT